MVPIVVQPVMSVISSRFLAGIVKQHSLEKHFLFLSWTLRQDSWTNATSPRPSLRLLYALLQTMLFNLKSSSPTRNLKFEWICFFPKPLTKRGLSLQKGCGGNLALIRIGPFGRGRGGSFGWVRFGAQNHAPNAQTRGGASRKGLRGLSRGSPAF